MWSTIIAGGFAFLEGSTGWQFLFALLVAPLIVWGGFRLWIGRAG